jgi:peptidoglycan-associated lipoprotein
MNKVKLSKSWIVALSLAAVMIIAGCGKKQAPPPPATPPPPPAPTASLTANPDTITQGDGTTLTWTTGNATDVSIDNGIGTVDASGSRRVSPNQTTTYTLTAKGAGGTQTATATVTVNPKAAPPVATGPSDEELFAQNVKDIFFDYDKSDIRPGVDSQNVQADAQFLQQHPNLHFTIEGHCDERGSTDYNLTLGNERANAVAQALQKAGVPASQMRIVTFGKEKPFCNEHTEDCWQQNRRGHFVLNK